MQKVTRKTIVVFFIGLLVVSFLTVVGSLAFFSANPALVTRNIAITDVIFILLYVLWIRLNKGYEKMYKSGLELEDEK